MKENIATTQIKRDLRECYDENELQELAMTDNIDEVGHLLMAYDITMEQLKHILCSMFDA